jgi:hypothetical protein
MKKRRISSLLWYHKTPSSMSEYLDTQWQRVIGQRSFLTQFICHTCL